MATNEANPVYLGVSVDEYFAEFSLLLGEEDPSSLNKSKKTSEKHANASFKVLAQQRVYLPRENLKSALLAFLHKNSDCKPTQAFVGLRFIERIFSYRLGGSVAQLTTEGFENWMQLRSLQPGLQSLSNADMVIPLPERILANGDVERELLIEDLEIIEAKLKASDSKRVCLHLMHSALHPAHLHKASAFFSERGFEVFTPAPSDNTDEVARWRQNTLNASVSGTFAELKEQIDAACAELMTSENIYYVSSYKKLFQNENQFRLSNLFATKTSFVEKMKGLQSAPSVLHLGIEKFYWTDLQELPHWQSPWGQVDLKIPHFIETEIQPTSAIITNSFNDLDFSTKSEGFEPGPMCLGRGQKPTLLDLFLCAETAQAITGLTEQIQATGIQRFKNTLQAVAKSSAQRDGFISNQKNEMLGLNQLQNWALKKLSMQILQLSDQPLLITGPLASLIGEKLCQINKNWKVLKSDFIDSTSLIEVGRQWKEPQA